MGGGWGSVGFGLLGARLLWPGPMRLVETEGAPQGCKREPFEEEKPELTSAPLFSSPLSPPLCRACSL